MRPARHIYARTARRTLLALFIPALLAACTRLGPAPATASTPGLEPQAAGYAAQDLGTLGGSSYANGVSADGNTVVGSSVTAGGGTHAFIWTPAGGVRDLGTLGGPTSYASAVSADGKTVVGSSSLGDASHAFIWTQAGGMRDLGTLGGLYSSASGVSADGKTVVGQSRNSDGYTHAFVWTAAEGLRDLGTLGDFYSDAEDVSADGKTVVGSSGVTGSGNHAFSWTRADGMRDLGTFGGDYSTAEGVSADGGTVVGWGDVAGASNSGYQRAFVWTVAGGMEEIGLDFRRHIARDVSADGRTVVGHSFSYRIYSSSAFVWTKSGGIRYLGELGGGNSEAHGVSADGQTVVGYTETSGGQRRATRWVAGGPLTPDVPDTYQADFETARTGTLYSVRLGSGVVHLGGDNPQNASVTVVGKRRSGNRVLQAHAARVVTRYGSRRLAVVTPGTSTPAPQGGRLKLDFTKLEPGGVTLSSLTLHNLTSTGAHLTFYYADGGAARHPLGTTAPGGSLTVPLAVAGLRAVDVFAPSAYTLDDVRFTTGD